MKPLTRLAVLAVAVCMLLPTLTEPAGVALAGPTVKNGPASPGKFTPVLPPGGFKLAGPSKNKAPLGPNVKLAPMKPGVIGSFKPMVPPGGFKPAIPSKNKSPLGPSVKLAPTKPGTIGKLPPMVPPGSLTLADPSKNKPSGKPNPPGKPGVKPWPIPKWPNKLGKKPWPHPNWPGKPFPPKKPGWWPGKHKPGHKPHHNDIPWWAYVPDINIAVNKNPAPAYPYPYPYPAGTSYQTGYPYPSYPTYPTVALNAKPEIDRLRGEIRSTPVGWSISLEYEVDIEDWTPAEQFMIRMYLTEDGNFVYDPDGNPVVIDLPLDQPTDIDTDELEFKDDLTFPLPPLAIHHATHTRVHAEVLRLNDGQTMDTEDHHLHLDS